MKTLRQSILCLLAFVALGAAAQPQDIAGTWAGKLAVAPGQELTLHVVLSRQPAGGYGAVLTSPDNGAIKDMRADTVTFDGGKLAFTVNALSGSYEGTLANGAVTGNWRQEGADLPLVLRPYTAPVLSQADKDKLIGSWVGKLTIPGGSLTVVTRFENNPAGEFVAFLDSPDQGAVGIPVSDVTLVDGALTYRVARVQGDFKGTLAGDKITGTWSQVGQGMALEMTKGAYTPQVTDLKLSADAMKALAGAWQGKITAGNGQQITLTLTFESPAPGQSTASIQVVEQGNAKLPVSAATFDAGKVVVRITPIQVEYTATVTGTTMAGDWKQLGMTTPVTLTKQ